MSGRGRSALAGASAAQAAPEGLWSQFSYVASSRYRERVVLSMAAKPRLPHQIAEDTKLRIAHVSRALRELREQGLVECLSPGAKTRGRLYGLTAAGSHLVDYFRTSSARYVPQKAAVSLGFVPKIRAPYRGVAFLRKAKGDAATREALRGWSVDIDQVEEHNWISLDAYAEFLELIEARWGDGSYEFVRWVSFSAIATINSVREEIIKAIPLEKVAERAPIAYMKEWNYGRLEVRTGRGWALFQHFDWVPHPGMCAVFLGSYQGILRARGAEGTVTETQCVRRGDDRCAFLAEWRGRASSRRSPGLAAYM